jgi:hypothetical protein
MDSAERDALCGDLAESGESKSQALHEVLSLLSDGVQLALGVASVTDSRQPYGTAERVSVARVERTSDGTVIYLWLYVKNWQRARDFRNVASGVSQGLRSAGVSPVPPTSSCCAARMQRNIGEQSGL